MIFDHVRSIFHNREKYSRMILDEFQKFISWVFFVILGALPLGEGGGAKHSPLTGAHGKRCKNHVKKSENNLGPS